MITVMTRYEKLIADADSLHQKAMQLLKQEDVVRELAKRLSMQEAGEAVEVNDYSGRR